MYRAILTQRFATNLDYARRLVDGLTEAQADDAPAPGMNTPRWIVGHLAQTADMVTLGLIWQQPRSIEPWDAWFNGGTTPTPRAGDQPTLAQTMQRLEQLHQTISGLVGTSSPDFYERSVPDTAPEGFRQRFSTVGTALAHTMLLHEMQHLGQLSAWRRVQGLPAV